MCEQSRRHCTRWCQKSSRVTSTWPTCRPQRRTRPGLPATHRRRRRRSQRRNSSPPSPHSLLLLMDPHVCTSIRCLGTVNSPNSKPGRRAHGILQSITCGAKGSPQAARLFAWFKDTKVSVLINVRIFPLASQRHTLGLPPLGEGGARIPVVPKKTLSNGGGTRAPNFWRAMNTSGFVV
jgi:hypothetical protein